MNKQDYDASSVPDEPGIYRFRDLQRRILYIGKATSLRDRVRSYFTADLGETRGPWLVEMLERASSVDFETTPSVLEALILEARLIKRHKPQYNTLGKDDRSFNYVIITKEQFPRILIVREREILRRGNAYPILKIFGPFTSGSSLRIALGIVRKIFPYRDKCEPLSGKPCFNRQIGLCPGVCSNEVTASQYSKTVRNITLFFEGKRARLRQSLEREMREAAKMSNFEHAANIRDTLYALEHIRDVALIRNDTFSAPGGFRIEAYDVAHLQGSASVGVMTVVENGEADTSAYRKFKIKSFDGINDTRALREIMLRRFSHTDWEYPSLVVCDGGYAQKRAAERLLKELEIHIPVVSVVKDDHHRPQKILGLRRYVQKYEQLILMANAEAHRFAIAYHRLRSTKKMREQMD